MRVTAISKTGNLENKNNNFKQNSGIAQNRLTSQYDLISFGMAKMPKGFEAEALILPKARTLAKEFRRILAEEGDGVSEASARFFNGLRKQSLDIKTAFALMKDIDGDSQFITAVMYGRPKLAGVFLEFVQTLPLETQKRFASSTNRFDNSHFSFADAFYSYSKPTTVNKLLEFEAKIVPTRVLRYKIPKTVASLKTFYPVAVKMAASEQLNKTQTLKFLRTNNHNNMLDDLINSVKENAEGPWEDFISFMKRW